MQATEPHQLDPLQLMMGTSGIVRVVLLGLIVASFAVWLIWLLKTLQVMRLRSLNHEFEREAEAVVATGIRACYKFDSVGLGSP